MAVSPAVRSLGALPFGWLFAPDDAPAACEIRNLCFLLAKQQRVTKNLAIAVAAPTDLAQFSRATVPLAERLQWLTAAAALRAARRVLFGAFRIAGMWVIARYARPRERFFARLKTRIITAEGFAAFVKDPDAALGASVFSGRKTAAQRRAARAEFAAAVRMPHALRARLSALFQERLAAYARKRLGTLTKRLAEANALFFAPKEMTEGRIRTLTAEAVRAAQTARQLTPDLESLATSARPEIERELSLSDPRDPLHAQFRRTAEYAARLAALTDGDAKGQTARIRAQTRSRRAARRASARLARLYLRDWEAGLKISARVNRLASISVNKTTNRTYFRIRAHYYADLAKFAGLIRRVSWLSADAAAAAADALQRHADAEYAPFLDEIRRASGMRPVERRSFLDDLYAAFARTHGDSAFFHSLSSAAAIKALLLVHLDDFARAQQEDAWLRWQAARLDAYVRDGSFADGFCGSREHAGAVSAVAAEFSTAAGLLGGYLQASVRRAVDPRAFVHARFRLSAVRLYRDRAESLQRSLRTGTAWPKGVYAWHMSLRWLLNAAWGFYDGAAEDFLLRGDYYRPRTLFAPEREELARYSDFFVDARSPAGLAPIDAYVETQRLLRPPRDDVSPGFFAPPGEPPAAAMPPAERQARVRALRDAAAAAAETANARAARVSPGQRAQRFRARREAKRAVLRFARTARRLLKNAATANRAARARRFSPSARIPTAELAEALAANVAVLGEYAWYARFFSLPRLAARALCRRGYGRLADLSAFGSRLRRAGGSALLPYGGYARLSRADALRLYLSMHFSAYPGLIVYDALPLKTAHEAALVKGMLLGAQNDSRFAIVFTDERDPLAQDLAIASLSVFSPQG